MELEILNKGYIYIKPHHLLDYLYDLAINYTHENEPNNYGSNNGILCLAFIKGLIKRIKFTLLADDICKPCKNLVDGKRCKDFFDDETAKSYGFKYKNDFNYQLDVQLNAALPNVFKFDVEQKMIDVLKQLKENITEEVIDLYLWKRPDRYKKTLEGISKAIEIYK